MTVAQAHVGTAREMSSGKTETTVCIVVRIVSMLEKTGP